MKKALHCTTENPGANNDMAQSPLKDLRDEQLMELLRYCVSGKECGIDCPGYASCVNPYTLVAEVAKQLER